MASKSSVSPGTVSDSGDGNKHDYLDEFISNLIKWGGLTRGVYNGGVNIQDNRYIVYGNVQRSLRGVMSILYGSSSLERSMFMSRFTSQWKTKDPAKWGELGGFIFYALNLPAPQKEKLLRADLPVILNLILTVAASDYNNSLHGTRGLSQFSTLIGNVGNIGMNHQPEITLAWLRAQDSLYDTETTQASASNVTPTRASVPVRASEAGVIVGVDEVPEMYAVHGTDPKTLLPSTVTAWDESGNTQELAVTWGSPKWYTLDEASSGDVWTEIDGAKAAEIRSAGSTAGL